MTNIQCVYNPEKENTRLGLSAIGFCTIFSILLVGLLILDMPYTLFTDFWYLWIGGMLFISGYFAYLVKGDKK